MEKRNESVTIAKGIAIFLMVIGHSGCPIFIDNFLSMFNMPLFFILSGFCFKDKHLTNEKNYFWKKIKGFYLPYIKWSIVFLLMHNIFYKFNIYNGVYGYRERPSYIYDLNDFKSHFTNIIISMSGHEQLLGGFWFMKAIFWGTIIFFTIRRMCKNLTINLLILLLATSFFSFFQLSIPYIGVGFVEFFAAFFIMFGHFYRNKKFTIEYNVYFNIISIVVVILGSYIWKASVVSCNFWQIIPYSATAILGSLVVFNFGHILEVHQSNISKRLLIYAGKFSFNVLTWHFISFKVLSLCIILLFGLNIKRLAQFPVIDEFANKGWWLLYSLIGITIPMIGTFYYDHLKNRLINVILNND